MIVNTSKQRPKSNRSIYRIKEHWTFVRPNCENTKCLSVGGTRSCTSKLGNREGYKAEINLSPEARYILPVPLSVISNTCRYSTLSIANKCYTKCVSLE